MVKKLFRDFKKLDRSSSRVIMTVDDYVVFRSLRRTFVIKRELLDAVGIDWESFVNYDKRKSFLEVWNEIFKKKNYVYFNVEVYEVETYNEGKPILNKIPVYEIKKNGKVFYAEKLCVDFVEKILETIKKKDVVKKIYYFDYVEKVEWEYIDGEKTEYESKHEFAVIIWEDKNNILAVVNLFFE